MTEADFDRVEAVVAAAQEWRVALQQAKPGESMRQWLHACEALRDALARLDQV